jgi:NTE family protein
MAKTSVVARSAKAPRIAIALGGGGARGLAHIAALDVLDEMGITPVAVSGTSMGAILGAAYAAGVSGVALRSYCLSLLRNRADVMAKLFRTRSGRFIDMFASNLGNPVLLDAEAFLDAFWPEAVPDRFEDLKIPFTAVATDFHGRCEAAFSTGLLLPAVAGSMALPSLFKPVQSGNLVLIDGGAVNPLPYMHLFDVADIVIAVDVTPGPVDAKSGMPNPFVAMLSAAQIMQGALTNIQVKMRPPHVLVRPDIAAYGVLDFFRAPTILKTADGIKAEMRAQIERKIATFETENP